MFGTSVKVYIGLGILYLACRQLKFTLYSGAVTTKALTVVVIPYIIPCLWLCGISYALCLLPSLLQCCLAVSSAAQHVLRYSP